MLRRYTFWLSAATLFQLLTGAIHAVSLLFRPEPTNEAERQMMNAVMTLKLDPGSGFQPTFWDLFTAVSTCFSLLCLLGGAINGYLLFKHAEPSLMRGIIGINLVVFGACFGFMVFFTFLPPIILTGLIFVNLLAAFIVVPNIEANV